jgi:hypothetical protein
MEATCSSETSVDFQRVTRRYGRRYSSGFINVNTTTTTVTTKVEEDRLSLFLIN